LKQIKLILLQYFIEYNAQTSLVRTWISQLFLSKKLILFFKNNFTRINHYKFIHHTSHLKPFLSYLPYIVHREYFSIICNVKKCVIIYGTSDFRPQDQLEWNDSAEVLWHLIEGWESRWRHLFSNVQPLELWLLSERHIGLVSIFQWDSIFLKLAFSIDESTEKVFKKYNWVLKN
jgi:hypothetical protein